MWNVLAKKRRSSWMRRGRQEVFWAPAVSAWASNSQLVQLHLASIHCKSRPNVREEWPLSVWRGGLNACQGGLWHLFRAELSKFKWAFAWFCVALSLRKAFLWQMVTFNTYCENSRWPVPLVLHYVADFGPISLVPKYKFFQKSKMYFC